MTSTEELDEDDEDDEADRPLPFPLLLLGGFLTPVVIGADFLAIF